MKLIVDKYENIENRGKTGKGEVYIENSFIQFPGVNYKIGGVDAMMKKDFKAIVAAYARRVKSNKDDLTAGKVTIEIVTSDQMFVGKKTTHTITGRIE